MQVTGSGDSEVARLSAGQRGYVSFEQLIQAGIGRGAIAHRVRNGRLYRWYPGIYLVGRNQPEQLGPETAAIMYVRGRAVLSHRSAGAIWAIETAPEDEVVLTLIAHYGRSRPRLTLHRAAYLDRRDLRYHERLPVTSPARTLLDLAGEVQDLEQALAAALIRRLTDTDEMEQTLNRNCRRPGAASLRKLLRESTSGFTRSQAEQRMRRLIRAANLPQPLVNVPVGGFVVDFLWPQAKLVVEVDGYDFHSNRSTFERDRRRDQILIAAGYTVIRITWRQLNDEPFAVVARLAQALAARAP